MPSRPWHQPCSCQPSSAKTHLINPHIEACQLILLKQPSPSYVYLPINLIKHLSGGICNMHRETYPTMEWRKSLIGLHRKWPGYLLVPPIQYMCMYLYNSGHLGTNSWKCMNFVFCSLYAVTYNSCCYHLKAVTMSTSREAHLAQQPGGQHLGSMEEGSGGTSSQWPNIIRQH